MATPNIILILSDQHNASLIAAAGDPFVRTPNLDRLMRRGTTLTNCYCASPLCVPSRMSMLAAQLPSKTGVFTNFQTLRSDQASFVHGLALAGYQTVLCGRMHFVGPDQRHGYHERLVGDLTAVNLGMPALALGSLKGTTDQHASALTTSGPGRSSVMAYDEDVVAEACSWLEKNKRTKPLFLTIGFYGPHCPFVCPRELFAYYYERLPVLAAPSAYANRAHPAIRRWLENRDMLDVPAEAVRRSRAAYYGLVEQLDGHVGRILQTVQRCLGLEKTILIYASDHGEMNGEHGLFWKSNFYEGSVRVPEIFHYPAMVEADRRIETPTSLLDLGPTLLGFCDGPSLPEADGQNLAPVLSGQASPDPDRPVISMLGDVKGESSSAMIREHEWKLVLHTGYEHPQLFKLDSDPAEAEDLGQDPKHKDVRSRLLRQLAHVWDGQMISHRVQHAHAHTKLIEAANQKLPPSSSEQWKGDASLNVLEQWP